MLSTRGPGDEVWRNGGTRSLDGWMRKARLMPPSSFDPRQENCSSPEAPTPTGCQRPAGGRGDAGGATASRPGREETSQEEEQRLLAPAPAGRPSCPGPRPCRRAPTPGPPRTQHDAALDPPNCPRSPAAPAPIPTKFPEPLPPGARPAPDNRWAAAPAGPGLSWPGPLHSSPAGAPGRPAPGRGGELAPLPPPYLPS